MFDFSFIKFRNIPRKTINEDDIRAFMEDRATKRFNMQYFQQNPINIVNKETKVAWLNVPFQETINAILSRQFSCEPYLYLNRNGKYAHCFKTQEELDEFHAKIAPYKELVFLRDCLDLSIALSMYDYIQDGEQKNTEFGEAEYQVKYKEKRKEDIQQLVDKTQYWLDKLPYFKLADCVCCVPTQHPVMSIIVEQLKGFSIQNISENVFWRNKNDEIKGKPLEEKLALLNSFDLQINCNVQGKTILLLDDMYQSGLTMQFVAMKMKQAGADRVFGITLVKALSNS